MKLLVTGSAGQVGAEILREAPRFHVEAQGLPRAALDIADGNAVRAAVARAKANGCDVVINAAAFTAVDKAESERDQAFAINGTGPGHLAAACRQNGLPLFHISTDYVFDGSKTGAYGETDPVAPLGIYGASKEEGERRVRDALGEHVIMRTSWVYAAHGHNFVKTMLRLANERDELRVVDDQRGIPTAAVDIARALLAIAGKVVQERRAGRPVPWGTYHYAAEGATTWCGFARAIIERAGLQAGLHPKVTAITTAAFPTPARRPANSELDCRLIAKTFAPPRRPWQNGLDEVLGELQAPKGRT